MSIVGEIWEEHVALLEEKIKRLEILVSFLCKELSPEQINTAYLLTDNELNMELEKDYAQRLIQLNEYEARITEEKRLYLKEYIYWLRNDAPDGYGICNILKDIDDRGWKIQQGHDNKISLVDKEK